MTMQDDEYSYMKDVPVDIQVWGESILEMHKKRYDRAKVFLGEWDSLEDVCQSFWPYRTMVKGALAFTYPEVVGVEFLLAFYGVTGGQYDFSAFVLFKRDGKLWEVNGSHCSCYGLENQWEPEETSVAALRHRVEHGTLGHGDFADELSRVLDDISSKEEAPKEEKSRLFLIPDTTRKGYRLVYEDQVPEKVPKEETAEEKAERAANKYEAMCDLISRPTQEFTKLYPETQSVSATEPTASPLDSQVGGDHYAKLGEYQPWIVLAKWMTADELRGFAKGTAMAYLARERDKGELQDIKKAVHTLELYLSLVDDYGEIK